MTSVADHAHEYIRLARTGQQPTVRVAKRHVESFLSELIREGFEIASGWADRIGDPQQRRIVETVLYATAGGALLGATIGGAVGGAPGAEVGAVLGAVAGFAAGYLAVTITLREERGALVISAR